MVELALRLVVSLALVVGLLLVMVRIGGRRFQGKATAALRVVHRQALTRSSAIAVIEVGGRVLVVGTTDQQVSMLTELDPASLEATAPAVAAPAPPAGPDVVTESGHQAVQPVQQTQPAPASPVSFAPLPRRIVQPVARPTSRPAASPESTPAPIPAASLAPAPQPVAHVDFDGASFAAHLDSAVRGLRAAEPTPATSVDAALVAAAAASGELRRLAQAPAPRPVLRDVPDAHDAGPSFLRDALDAAEALALLDAAGTHLAATGTEAPTPMAPMAPRVPTGPTGRTGRRTASRGGARLATPAGTRLAAPAGTGADGPLAGSILSPTTWKQAAAAARGRR